jgi:hypothetical protein
MASVALMLTPHTRARSLRPGTELFSLPEGYEVVLGNGGSTAFWESAVFGMERIGCAEAVAASRAGRSWCADLPLVWRCGSLAMVTLRKSPAACSDVLPRSRAELRCQVPAWRPTRPIRADESASPTVTT